MGEKEIEARDKATNSLVILIAVGDKMFIVIIIIVPYQKILLPEIVY